MNLTSQIIQLIKIKHFLRPMIIGCGLLLMYSTVNGQIIGVSSSYNNPWQNQTVKLIKSGPYNETIEIFTSNKKQVIHGFGACFNELGWEAMSVLKKAQRDSILKNVFDTTNGCRFSICRMPIGANDFSIGYYSLNDEYLDYAMDSFSLSRDKQRLIPYIKSAMKYNPELKIWGSPWTPPTWMKENMHYGGRVINNNWGQYQGGNQEDLYDYNRLKKGDDILNAYAQYFVNYIDQYKQNGIEIYAIHPQNEVFANQLFPSSVWEADQLAKFMADYLFPALEDDHPEIEVWLGTINSDSVEYVEEILNYKNLKSKIAGIGVQWGGLRMIDTLRLLYPELKIMQTESECNNGMNEWFTAEHTWDLIHETFLKGGNSYMYWNLVLDEIGLSHWMWRQNSMISVNKFTGEIVYNPEFYLMKHFSYFVEPGAKLLDSSTNKDLLAFINPDKCVVVVVSNKNKTPKNFQFKINNKTYTTELKPKTFNSFLIPPK